MSDEEFVNSDKMVIKNFPESKKNFYSQDFVKSLLLSMPLDDVYPFNTDDEYYTGWQENTDRLKQWRDAELDKLK